MIDPKAVVASNAEIGKNVRIGAYAIIEDQVTIGDDSQVGCHSVIHSHTSIGSKNQIHEFVSLGGAPQSSSYRDEPTKLEIGDDNTIREFVTMHRGTAAGEEVTRIGNSNFFMAYTHIAHDCQIGDDIVLTNNTNLAGHVTVGDHAFLGGFTISHQYCRIGEYCMTGLNTVLRQDVAPYVTVSGNPAFAVSINSIGLRRRGFSNKTISELKIVYRLYFQQQRDINEIIVELSAVFDSNVHVQRLCEFVNSSERGVTRRSRGG